MIRIPFTSWKPCVAWMGAWVVMAMSTAAISATPVDAARPPASSTQLPQEKAIQEIDELDEVVVRGKHLKDQIIEAEDEFYKIFNDVNTDDRYDTHCVYLQLDRESRMQNRACIPGFVADAMADWAPFKARCQPPMEGSDEFACLDRNGDRRLTRDEASARTELEAAFTDLDVDRGPDGYLNREEFNGSCSDCDPAKIPQAVAVYMPPTPDAILADGTRKWYDHMVKVIAGDPRLHKMADHLGELYQELSVAQHRYDELDAEAKAKAGKRNMGPRVR